MTPEQIQEAEAVATFYEGYAAGLRTLGLEDTTRAAFAARCIRACIEASKEGNWSALNCETHYSTFEVDGHGFDFFQRAITGEPS